RYHCNQHIAAPRLQSEHSRILYGLNCYTVAAEFMLRWCNFQQSILPNSIGVARTYRDIRSRYLRFSILVCRLARLSGRPIIGAVSSISGCLR
ncbi:MAG: hypothetical protein ACRETL_00080, partial [Gammaproteobacteria bacterium]